MRKERRLQEDIWLLKEQGGQDGVPHRLGWYIIVIYTSLRYHI